MALWYEGAHWGGCRRGIGARRLKQAEFLAPRGDSITLNLAFQLRT